MLIFPLKKEWYKKIKNGEKKIEYREVKDYWTKRIFGHNPFTGEYTFYPFCYFRCGYTRDLIEASIIKVEIINGKDTDLHIDKPVYAIHLKDIKEA